MCLITYSPDGARGLDWSTLNYSRKHMNDDGFGLAWFNQASGVWTPMRSLRSHKLAAAVKKIPQKAPLVIHQRYATHGRVCMENVHPFDAAGALLFHNGTLDGTRASRRTSFKNSKGEWEYLKSDVSDTRAYCEDELEPLIMAAGYDWLTDEKGIEAVENRIGYGSVFAICLPEISVPVLINERRGDWETHQGFRIFYSNSYARPGGYSWRSGHFDSDYYGTEWMDSDSNATSAVAKRAAQVVTHIATKQAQANAARADMGDVDDSSTDSDGVACYASMYPDSHDSGETAAQERWREHEREWDSEWEAYLEQDAQAYQARKAKSLSQGG